MTDCGGVRAAGFCWFSVPLLGSVGSFCQPEEGGIGFGKGPLEVQEEARREAPAEACPQPAAALTPAVAPSSLHQHLYRAGRPGVRRRAPSCVPEESSLHALRDSVSVASLPRETGRNTLTASGLESVLSSYGSVSARFSVVSVRAVSPLGFVPPAGHAAAASPSLPFGLRVRLSHQTRLVSAVHTHLHCSRGVTAVKESS